jgi:iron-sulfur cluster assembly protein
MFTITQRAAQQILQAAQEGNMEGLALRLAPYRQNDGSIEYNRMGFDEIKAGDIHLLCEGVNIVFEPIYKELLEDALMDFVEIEPGEFCFIFANPNDPNYVPPQQEV